MVVMPVPLIFELAPLVAVVAGLFCIEPAPPFPTLIESV
jgi:hypothetical protein